MGFHRRRAGEIRPFPTVRSDKGSGRFDRLSPELESPGLLPKR